MSETNVGVESAKFWADYLKHMATLATGSILLIATFLEKLFAHPTWKAAVVVALLGFLLSVLGSTVAFSSLAISASRIETDPSIKFWSDDPRSIVAGAGVYMSWIGFAVGIVSFTVFTIRNLLVSP